MFRSNIALMCGRKVRSLISFTCRIEGKLGGLKTIPKSELEHKGGTCLYYLDHFRMLQCSLILFLSSPSVLHLENAQFRWRVLHKRNRYVYRPLFYDFNCPKYIFRMCLPTFPVYRSDRVEVVT